MLPTECERPRPVRALLAGSPGIQERPGPTSAARWPGAADRARAVLVEARGQVVSYGVDVALFSAIAEGVDPVVRGSALWTRLLRIAQTLEELPVPTVFAAHGLTLTAALELAFGV